MARAALRIVGTRGMGSLTTASLAAEVELSTGALFRHFPSFDAILDEMVACALRSVEETFPDTGRPALERLLDLAERRVRLLVAEPGIAWMLRSDEALHSLPPGAVNRLRRLAKRSRDYLVDAIGEGAALGTIRRDIAPELLVVPVIGTIHTLVGMSGVARRTAAAQDREIGNVLDALARLLAPPA